MTSPVDDRAHRRLPLAGRAVMREMASSSAAALVLALGGKATLAAGFAFLRCRVRPRPVEPWLVEYQALELRYRVGNVALGGARQVRLLLLGALAGLAAVGQTVVAASLLAAPAEEER